MTHIDIVIDGVTEFDGELSEYTVNPPALLRNIDPHVRPAPHMVGILMAVQTAIGTRTTTSINVETFSDGWSMRVREL